MSGLFESLSQSVLTTIEKKLNALDIIRNRSNLVVPSVPEPETGDTLQTSGEVLGTVSPGLSPASSACAPGTVGTDSIDMKTDRNMSNSIDMKMMNSDTEAMTAIKAIQNGSRSVAARVRANKLRDEASELAADLLLVEQDSFLSLVGDIVHNTMFNLIQEASYDEFQINADPLRFMVKKE